MNKLLFSLLYLCSSNFYLIAQPSIQWQKSLGGTSADYAESIQQTNDGGYIVAGWASLNNGNITGNHGSNDYWVVKLNSAGTIQWQKSLGGTNVEQAYSIQQTTDGGYIVAGFSGSNDGDVMGNHGSYDCWVVKLNSAGTIQWQKCLGGTGGDEAYSIQQTTDGGYIVAGSSNSNDGDVTGNHGWDDCWIVKLNSTGIIQWQKCLGGTASDVANSIQQTTDGGYIVAGISGSNDSDVTGNHGMSDYWVVKLNSIGTIQWEKCLGGTLVDFAYSIQQTTDSGYIVAGFSISNDGDVTGNHGNPDYWIVKLNNVGNIQWQKSLGGTGRDWAFSIRQTNDGGYIVAGGAESNDGDVTGNHGSSDCWILKLNSTGAIQWQTCFGGTSGDQANAIQQTTDGGYIVAGQDSSNGGDVTGNQGGFDYWVVKLNPVVGIDDINSSISNLQIIPNPVSQSTAISFSLDQSENVSAKIYDITGKAIKTFVNVHLAQGPHKLIWDISDNSNNIVDDGMYFLKLEADYYSVIRKVLVQK